MDIKINLLPSEKKEEIKNLRLVGVISKIFFMEVFAVVVFLVFLSFCIYFIKIEGAALTNEVDRFERSESYQEVKEAQNFLEKYSQEAQEIKKGLSSSNKGRSYEEIFLKVNKIIPQGVYLRELGVEKDQMNIKGVAKKREDFLFLKDQLEREGIFKKVESPISNLIAEEEVSFELKATFK